MNLIAKTTRQIADSNITHASVVTIGKNKGLIVTENGMYTVEAKENGKLILIFRDHKRNAVIVESDQKNADHLITAVRKYHHRIGM